MLEVNDAPSIELLELFCLRFDSDATWSNHHQAEAGGHLRRILNVGTWLLHKRIKVFLTLENKDIVCEVCSKLGRTLLDLATLECNWVSRLKERPLAWDLELVFIVIFLTSGQKLFETARRVFDFVSNWAKRLSFIGLHTSQGCLGELIRSHACDFDLEIGALVEFHNILVKDVTLAHIVVLDFFVEAIHAIAATGNHIRLNKISNQAHCSELFCIFELFLFLLNRVAILIKFYWLGRVANFTFVLSVHVAVQRVGENSICASLDLIIVASELNDVSQLSEFVKDVFLHEAHSPLKMTRSTIVLILFFLRSLMFLSECEIKDESFGESHRRIDHSLDDIVDLVVTETLAIAHVVTNLVLQISEPLVFLGTLNDDRLLLNFFSCFLRLRLFIPLIL